MDEPTTKASLLAAVRRERAEWERIVAEAGVGRMDEPGAMGEWTFKDLLAHLTAWQQHEQAPLEGALTGARPAPPWPANLNPHRDQDTINAHKHYPWLGGEALGPSVLRHVTLHYHQDHESDVRAWLARDLPTPESDPALRDVQAS